MVLASCRWYSTSEFTDANEDGEVSKPDEYEAVDKTCRAATILESIIIVECDVCGLG